MRCYKYEKFLVLYLHGELAERAQRQLEQHLDRCSKCRQKLEEFRAVIDRAVRQAVAVPSTNTVGKLRYAANAVLKGARQRASGTRWGYRSYGAHARIVAAGACVILVIAAGLVVTVGRRRSTRHIQDPSLILSEQVVPASLGKQRPAIRFTSDGESGILTDSLPAVSAFEARLANLEADALYMEQEIALETTPLLDKRVQSLEHAVIVLGLALE